MPKTKKAKPRARREAAIPLKERTYYCVICTKPFTPSKWNQKTCCGAHANELARRQHREKSAAKVEEKHSERFCIIEECRKPFKPRNDQHVCCSTKCSDLRKQRLAIQKRAEKRGVYASDVGSMAAPVIKAKTDELIHEMQERGFFVSKVPQQTDDRFKVDLKQFDGDKIKFAVMSDTHFCSKYQQLTHLKSFYALCEQEEISDVFHCGDIDEGSGNQHKGQQFELHTWGSDAAVDYTVEHYPRINGITTQFITGSHDNSFWKDEGVDIGKAISEKREDLKYLGYAGAYIDIAPGVDIHLMHPDGGTAYALSYNCQRRIEAYTPSAKPRMAFFGHYHRVFDMPSYRNCDGYMVGCFQSQTPFLKAKSIYPILGGWIIEAWLNENGIARARSEFIRFYEPVENDY